MIHRGTHPNLDEPDCFGCKIASISFGTVPGARKDAENQVSRFKRRERELDRYREKRRLGEQPDNTTFEGMEATERRSEEFERAERQLSEVAPPETIKSLKKSATNVQE